ncbi:Signal transducer regulating beta-lactamase production, contains metallopeptidase domain [Pustulibacterium marinum]|uniref:Signal transducer regulating beta-lactamase production, contains metallopeptidase domain n=1 Tax=Pustulibacterium marinum TaxID=1224947 RepID=A0A1I7I5R2_9FLAO|nr:M56 family metallopeptidase [Pustulibacterium marinum]SFU68264.1 Signal transducer regulating beta-lactamase production, contains metallopeptidase domain [Pustulibacterium marinum]
MLQYLVLSIACQVLFLLLYDVFLKKETFFNSNRAYLLFTPLISLVLPLIHIPNFGKIVPRAFVLPKLEVATTSESVVQLQEVVVTGESSQNLWSQITAVELVFIIGVLLSFSYFLFKIISISKLKERGTIKWKFGFYEVTIPKSNIAFSFFNNMFLGEEVKQKNHDHIIAHELVHIQQKHSWDLLYFEVFRIVFWFNPLVYMYQKRITELHEFIADRKTSQQNKKEHYQQLLQEVFQTENISFINQFFNQSLIKKRIKMLQKSNSKKRELFKYVLIIPMLAGILAYTAACSQDETETITQEETAEVSEKALKLQYLKEIQDKVAAGENIHDLMVAFMKIEDKGENVPSTFEEHCYQSMLLYVMADKMRLEEDKKEEIKESLFNSTYDEYLVRFNSEKKFNTAKEVTYFDDDYADATPFTRVAKKPVFKGCENAVDASECFKTKLDAFIAANFKYPESAKAEGIQGRQYVMFTIGTDGNVHVSGLRGNDERLEQEAKRLIEALPTMIPGEDANGNKVPVTFAYPIVFKLS